MSSINTPPHAVHITVWHLMKTTSGWETLPGTCKRFQNLLTFPFIVNPYIYSDSALQNLLQPCDSASHMNGCMYIFLLCVGMMECVLGLQTAGSGSRQIQQFVAKSNYLWRESLVKFLHPLVYYTELELCFSDTLRKDDMWIISPKHQVCIKKQKTAGCKVQFSFFF